MILPAWLVKQYVWTRMLSCSSAPASPQQIAETVSADMKKDGFTSTFNLIVETIEWLKRDGLIHVPNLNFPDELVVSPLGHAYWGITNTQDKKYREAVVSAWTNMGLPAYLKY